jgi:hypothetical protein
MLPSVGTATSPAIHASSKPLDFRDPSEMAQQ